MLRFIYTVLREGLKDGLECAPPSPLSPSMYCHQSARERKMIGSQPCWVVWFALRGPHIHTHEQKSYVDIYAAQKQQAALTQIAFYWLYIICSFPSRHKWFLLFIYIPRRLSVCLSRLSVSPRSPPRLLSNCITLVLPLFTWLGNMRAFPAGQNWQVYFPLTTCHLS